jgi:hypothetical protein
MSLMSKSFLGTGLDCFWSTLIPQVRKNTEVVGEFFDHFGTEAGPAE